MKERKSALAPCGVFCGACPSYEKTCLGCASESKEQNRTSKWGCKIRICCYTNQKKNYCIACGDFPCKKIRKKLLDSHPGNPKFQYRHEIPEIFAKLKEMTVEDYLEFQKNRWVCPHCGGLVHFYDYRCSECGKNVMVK